MAFDPDLPDPTPRELPDELRTGIPPHYSHLTEEEAYRLIRKVNFANRGKDQKFNKDDSIAGFTLDDLIALSVDEIIRGWFQWKEGFGPDHDEEDGDLEMEVSPGIWQELPEGVEAVANDPQYPSGEFAMFHKAMLRGMASGMNVTYVNLANDLEGVNFSSIRQGTLDEREHWKEMQEGLIEQLLAPIFEAWLRRALLKGRIVVNGKPLRAERLEKYRAVVWQPRRWDWIDPNADVKAAVTSKNNLLASPSQIIRDRGQDPETIWREIGRDIAAVEVEAP